MTTPSRKGLQKKIQKEVHKAQKTYAKKPTAEKVPTSIKILKAYPPKAKAKAEAFLAKAEKRTAIKKKKINAKVVKRSSPGKTITSEAPPRHAHMENERWMRTLNQQSKENSMRLQKKRSKK